ncbi:MAG TPA: DUF4132 domain-containing protein [Verrucomicrobiae bacterium]|jgi:hypothetical protein
MLDWLKKLGGKKPFENKAGLDDKSLELLHEDFAVLDNLSDGISQQVIRFLVDGEGAEVLTHLSVLNDAAKRLRLRCTSAHYGLDGITTRSEFFKNVQCDSVEFFHRLGRVYETCAQQLPRRQFLPFGDPKLNWLEILLLEAFQLSVNTFPRRCTNCPAITADLVEAMIRIEGLPEELLVKAAFQPELNRFGGPDLEPVFENLGGLAKSAVRHRTAMLAALDQADFKQRAYAVSMMHKCGVPPGEFLEKLVALALDSSKQVREQALFMLADAKAMARPLVERAIMEGANEEKLLAVELLWSWEGEAARAFLESRLAGEKNKKVLRAIEDKLAAAVQATAPAAATLELPPLPPMPSHAPLGPETEAAWQQCFQKINDAITKLNAGQAGKKYGPVFKHAPASALEKSFALMQAGEAQEGILKDIFNIFGQRELIEPIREFWQRPELNLLHLVRFFIHLGVLRIERHDDRGIFSYGYWMEQLMPVFRRAHPDVGLRELGAAFTAAGLDPRRIGIGLLQSYREYLAPFGLPPAQIWPYWAENLDLLEQGFVPTTGGFMERYYHRHARQNAFHALATFPHPPERLVPLLWKIALGGKSERPPAQRCLEGLPDKFERLSASLATGDTETRAAAAEWLGRIGDKRAVDVLLAALKREKNETTKGAMMSALELLGASVDQFVDRQALLKDAEKGVAKGVPEDLSWFPFDRLPVVHWADNGQPVEPAILKWWLIQGFKLKNPAPGPLLRRYCASFKTNEREALGQFVLEAWIGKDTSPRSGKEAEAEAMRRAHAAVASAQHWANWVKQNPQMAQQMAGYAPKQQTLQEHYEEILPIVQREPTGTASSSKGVLSLAGACVGAGAAPVVGRYLKDWYGMRAAQCRALLQMLAWVEHKTATQLLLAVGSRFRTKGIQEEANAQTQALAERKGWSVAELADRTIPSAGMDDDGVLTLDFGPRRFTAKLNEDLEFTLSDPDGKPIKSLPDPRKDDDEAKATEAKKIFSSAKKELKSVVTMQRDRLYEAMCTQRTWPFEDWNIYLNRHIIARHHCQRLVWAVVREEKTVALFRPLPDGSLTDASDDPVTLKPDDFVRLAHECQVTPEQSQAWRGHLKDYEVEPLFEQFGRPGFSLPEERKQEDELADFRGHLLEAFKLRGRATKLGYTRGQAQDGGWFFEYHKRFPTLGMEAVLEFTGNGLPEENRTVGLTSFSFARVAPEGESVDKGKMSLGEVPPVLLTECWNDIRQIAAEGPGFDPEWEKKTQM